MFFLPAIVVAKNNYGEQFEYSDKVDNIVDYICGYLTGKCKLNVLRDTVDVIFVPRGDIQGTMIKNMSFASKISYKSNERKFYQYSELNNFIVLDTNDNVIFLQLSLSEKLPIDFFLKLKRLKYLSIKIESNDFPVLIDLQGNEFLEELFVRGGHIEDLILPADSSLEMFGSYSTKVERYTNLNSQHKLSIFRGELDAFGLRDLNDISSIQMLTLVGRGRIKTDFSKMNKLKYLALPGDRYFDVDKLYDLTNLKELSLGSGINVSGKKLPKSLTLLIYGGMNNDAMPSWDGHSNLKELIVSKTSINKIVGMSELVNLEKLSIVDSPINEIRGLESLVNLKELTIEGSNIEDINNVHHLTQLEYLYLPYNKIRVIEDLNLPSSLKSLRLYGNDIERIDLLELKDLPDSSVMIDTDPEFENNTPSLRRKIL